MSASSTVKRQRKRKRVDTDGDPEFQVAPMVDVLLVLLLFFMAITSTEVLKKNKNLVLPDAKEAKPGDSDKKHEIIVNIAWDNKNSEAHFSMDEINYPNADALTGVIGARTKQDPRSYVVIRADKDVEYSNVSDMMTACANAGVATVRFAVITGGGDAKKAAPAGTASN